jgi:NAD(P)-dependent dehydrogenase (short-subunit alcohol dehydrogenase family)
VSAFEGARVVVTGAAHGIGRAVAEAFHARGARVALLDMNQDALAETCAALGERASGVVADVGDPASLASGMARAIDDLNGVDVAVANAGIYPSCPALELTAEAWDRVMDVNARGAFLTCQAAGRAMVESGRGGTIVTMASGSARFAREGAAHYCASKAAIVMLTRVLALELARHGIRVNAVSPGIIDVPGGPTLAPEYKSTMTRAVPQERPGAPSDVAAAVLALADPDLAYVTGQILAVDGGLSAGRYGIPISADQGDANA